MVVLTGDHTTPARIGDHTFEPVPFAVTLSSNLMAIQKLQSDSNSNKRVLALHLKDQVQKFDEVSCGGGILGRFPGSEVMALIKNVKQKVDKCLTE